MLLLQLAVYGTAHPDDWIRYTPLTSRPARQRCNYTAIDFTSVFSPNFTTIRSPIVGYV